MTSTGIPIISEDQMRADRPDALLVSPWFFRSVFLNREREYLRSGGLMVFPLPHFEITRLGHE
jgi:NDP-4-keto-2,6-dideoxyhexose 3-C-methyltransferase